MKPRAIFLLFPCGAALVLLAIGVAVAAFSGRTPEEPSPAVENGRVPVAIRRVAVPPSSPSAHEQDVSPKVSVVSPAESLPVLLEKIEAAETPAVLDPYLSSGRPEVRVAAVDAMLRLGDSAAVPLLDAAARKLPPEDGAALSDAARFLELPDAVDFFQRSSAAPKPPEAVMRPWK
jgi:hypothetical protein